MNVKKPNRISDERWKVNSQWVVLTHTESTLQQTQHPSRLFRQPTKKKLISTRQKPTR